MMHTQISTIKPGHSIIHSGPINGIKRQFIFANFLLYLMMYENSKIWDSIEYQYAGTLYTLQIGLIFPKNKYDSLFLILHKLPREGRIRMNREINLILKANRWLYETCAIYHPQKIFFNYLPDISLSRPIDFEKLINENRNILKKLLINGSCLYTCSLNDITDMKGDIEIGKKLQNKNYSSYLNEVWKIFTMPKTLRINQFPIGDMDELLSSDDTNLIPNLFSFANFHRSTDSSLNRLYEHNLYLLKISVMAIGGGVGVTKIDLRNISRVREILKTVRYRKAAGEISAFQISEMVKTGTSNNNFYPLNSNNDEYFSPCVTFRIGDRDGDYHIIGVSDHILKHGIKYFGSYYSKRKKNSFLNQQSRNLFTLISKLHKIGLRGNNGFDFIKDEHGIFTPINDLNTIRLNGSDLRNNLLLLSLENVGIEVEDLYSGIIKFDSNMKYDEVYGEISYGNFKNYLYNCKDNSGVILLPNFNSNTGAKDDNYNFLAIYVNMKKKAEQYSEFFEKFINKDNE